MSRLRYNGLTATLGGSLTNSATSITFAAALTHSNGTAVPTLAGGDYIPLTILDSTGALSEIVWLTTYTAAATTGTISRGMEGTTGVAHATADGVVHSPSARDIPAPYVVASASAYNASSATTSVTVPSTAQVGDLLVYYIGASYNVSGTPTGWTPLQRENTSFLNQAIFVKTCAVGDINAAATCGLGGTDAWTGYILVIRDAVTIRQSSTTLRAIGSGAAGWPSATPLGAGNGDLCLLLGAARTTGASVFALGTSVVSRSADSAMTSAIYRIDGTIAPDPIAFQVASSNGSSCATLCVA